MQEEVVEILAQQPMFAGLEQQELRNLAAIGKLQRVGLGELVFKEGAPGEAAFIVYSGRIRIVKASDGGKPVTLGALARGDLFGERAILADEPRMATARAAEDSVLIRIDKADFSRFFDDHTELQPYFERLTQDRALINFLRLDTLFGAMPPKLIIRLFSALEETHHAAGSTIYEQGDEADALYVIREGEAIISEKRGALEVTLGMRSPGEVFGERSLFSGDGRRRATVRANTELSCLRIGKARLDAILADAPRVRELLMEQAEQTTLPDGAAPPPAPAPRTPEQHAPDSVVADTAEEPAYTPTRRPFVRQNDETDCGAACLAMAAGAYGKRLSLSRLRDAAEVGPEGASLADVAAGAERVGFDTRALRADYAGLQGQTLPAIAHWGGNHYVIVYEAAEDRVIVADPAIGILKMRRAEFEQGWTGMMLALRPTPALFGEPEAQVGLRRYFRLARPYLPLLAQAFLATLTLGALGLATPLFSQAVVDHVLTRGDAELLDILLLGAAAAAVFSILAALARQYLLLHISQRLALRLEADLFRQALRLPLRFFLKRKVGDVLTRFADNARIKDLITGQAMQTLADLLTATIYFAVLLLYSIELTAIVVGFLALAALVALLSAPALKRTDQRLFEKTAASQSKLVETITRIRAVKAAAAETPVRWAYEEVVTREALVAFEGERLRMTIGALSRAIGLAAGLVVLWHGANLALAGEMTVGQLVAFMGIMAMALQPAMAVVAMWGTYQEALVAARRLADVYDAEPEEPGGRVAPALPRLKGHLQIENVTFRYAHGARPALANLTLEVQPGQTAAVVGRSGSGKTTLAGLIQRLHAPESGRVRIDGHDLASVDLRALRRQLGVVLQEDTLFTATIRENIALADTEAPVERVVTAAKMAAAHDFITEFPMGYDTMVGEVGVALSGGQRQRIAIARALLSDPAVLIFDEATSALDAESESAIRRNLDAILKDRTALVIAHRLSTVRDADVIFVIDEGAVVEQGAHAELMAKKGLYAYLVGQQIGE